MMNEIKNSEAEAQLPATMEGDGDVYLQDNESLKYLTFNVSGGIYGVAISGVKEITEYPSLTRVPMTPAFIRGVINLRGNVVPVIDLAVRLGKASQEASNRSCVIIVEIEADDEKTDIGIVVDAVTAVIDIPNEDIEVAPAFGAEIRSDFISGMGKRNEKFVVLLELERVLSIDELAELTESLGR